MKYFIFCSIILLCLSVQAQELPVDSTTSNITFTRVIKSKDIAAAQLYTRSKEFLLDRDKFFICDNTVKNREWAIGRVAWGQNTKDLKLGYRSADSTGKTLTGKFVIVYRGTAYECVQFLTIKADIYIACKDGKARIRLTNFTYDHYNAGAPPKEMSILGYNSSIGSRGTLEELQKFNLCEETRKQLNDFIESGFYSLTDQYRDYIKLTSDVAKQTNDNW